jgi:hypothetical protein
VTWALALKNMESIQKDTRLTCQHCGCKYEPSKLARTTMYCTVECRGLANTAKQQAQRKEVRERKVKDLALCCEPYRKKVENKRYWKEVFGNVA